MVFVDSDISLDNNGSQSLQEKEGASAITLYIPLQSMIRALVMIKSRVSESGKPVACPIPSRMTLPDKDVMSTT